MTEPSLKGRPLIGSPSSTEQLNGAQTTNNERRKDGKRTCMHMQLPQTSTNHKSMAVPIIIYRPSPTSALTSHGIDMDWKRFDGGMEERSFQLCSRFRWSSET